MKDEAEFKRIFKKSVRVQKGFAASLSAPLVSGIPDLFVVMPGYIPVVLEAKWFGELKYGFKRKIPYTALQKDFLDGCNNVYNCTALGLIGFKLNNMVHWTITTGSAVRDGDGVYGILEGGLFNVSFIFGLSGVPRLNGCPS